MPKKAECVVIKELLRTKSRGGGSYAVLRIVRWNVNNIYQAPRLERRSFVQHGERWVMRKMTSLSQSDVEYIARNIDKIRPLMKAGPDENEPIFKEE